MVYRNNNLNNIEKEKTGEVPVYPFNVDVPSFPERKYLIGVYRFARMSYIALLVAMVLCLLTIIRAFSRDISPKFIKWNNIENRFQYVNYYYNKKPSTQLKEISYSEYLNEYFIKTYLTKRFSISETNSENYNNWCECDNKEASKMGIFNLNEECYLCLYSAQNVYKSFSDNVLNAYTTMSNNGITRTVDLLDITFQNGSETNPELSVIEWFLNKTKTIFIQQTYRVNFIVNEFKNKTLQSRDILTGYITINGIKKFPQKRNVISENYMFNPNYDLILKNYSEKANAIK